ncbi:OmpA family protein [Vibrio sp. JC009]|uniref:OmpA family protein n=1 Tax=Vibrio sp. JC009 TaxID=2912314 RepID=UPI0023B14898|nr:OmpA family protein [Vibrio sp. JC009]WED24465.1 OmpA family protein [Vibrio sp. JC009]
MRNWLILLVLALSGCAAPQMSKIMPGSMLDVAPQNEAMLLHPEWGEPEQQTGLVQSVQTNMVEGPYGVRRSGPSDAFTLFLSQMGIEHEVLPGDHLIVKLKRKVEFTPGSDRVSGDSLYLLNQIGAYVSQMPYIDVIIEGHTDSTGSSAVNESLSQRRANMVKSELMKYNVSSASIYTRGYGDYMPKCSNSTKSGRACNRRVELSFVMQN